MILALTSGLKFFALFLAIAGTAFSISLCGIGVGLYAGLAALEALCGRRAWPAYPAWKLFLPLLASLVVSVIVSDRLEVSFRGFIKYAEGFALLYAASELLVDPKNFRRAAMIFFAAIFAGSLAAFWQDAFGRDYFFGRAAIPYRGDFLRVTGLFKHSNDFATFLVPGMLGLLGYGANALGRRDRKGAALAGALLLFATYALARTMSRGGLISLGAGLFVFFFAIRKTRYFFAAVAAFLAIAIVAQPNLFAHLAEIFDTRMGNSPERVLLIQTAWAMTMAAPFFGLGLNTYSDNFPRFRPPDYPAIMYAHNTYLQISSEAGLVGLGLFTLFIGAVVAGVWRRVMAGRGFDAAGASVLAGVVAFLVNGGMESVFQSTQLRTLFWILLGALVAWSRRRAEAR